MLTVDEIVEISRARMELANQPRSRVIRLEILEPKDDSLVSEEVLRLSVKTDPITGAIKFEID